MTISWSASEFESIITDVSVFKDGVEIWTRSDTMGASGTATVTLQAGQSATYRIEAVNGSLKTATQTVVVTAAAPLPPSDTTSPSISMSVSPSSPSPGATVTIDWSVTDSGGSGLQTVTAIKKLNGTSQGSTTAFSGSFSWTAVAGQTYSVDVTARDVAGNTSSNSRSVTIPTPPPPPDTTSPSISMTMSPSNPSPGTNVTITWSVTDSGGSGLQSVTATKRINGVSQGTSAATSSSFSWVAVAGQTFAVDVSARDVAGNVSSNSRSVTIPNPDTIPPVISLTVSPANPIQGQLVTVTWSITDSGGSGLQTVQVTKKINNTAMEPFTTPSGQFTWTATVGQTLTVTAVATDGAGNTTTENRNVSVVADTTAPAVSMTVSPASPSPGDTVTISWSVTDSGSGVQSVSATKRVNGASQGTSAATSSSFSWTAVAGQTFSVDVTASDLAGNAASDSRSVTIPNPDTIPPVISLTVSPANPIQGQLVTVTWSISDSGGSGLQTVQVTKKINNTALEPFTEPSGQFTWTATVGQTLTVTAVATDGAGNTSTANRNVSAVADTTAPAVSMTVSPVSPSPGDTVTISWSVTDSGSGVQSVSATKRVNGASQGTSAATSSSFSWTAVAGQTFSVDVTATDLAGNAASDSRNVSIPSLDQTAPQISLSVSPANPLDGELVTVTWSITDTGGSGLQTVEVTKKINNTALEPFTEPSGQFIWTATVGQTLTVTAVARDGAGNTTTENRTVHVTPPPDITAPVISLEALPANPLHGELVTVTWSITDTGGSGLQTVEVTKKINNTALEPFTEPSGQFTWTATAGQTLVVTALARDYAGNVSTANRTVHVTETTPPEITLQALPANPTAGQVVTVTWSIKDNDGGSGLQTVEVTKQIGGQALEPFTEPSGQFIWTATAGQTMVVTAYASDQAGNVATDSRTVHVPSADTTPPMLTLSAPIWARDPEISYSVTDTDLDTYSLTWMDGTEELIEHPILLSGPVGTVTFTNGIDGRVYGFTLTARDKAGNEATESATVNIDKAAPTGQVSAPASLPNGIGDSDVPIELLWGGATDNSGSGIDGFELFVRENDGPWTSWRSFTAAETTANYPGRSSHTYHFALVITDNVGNRRTYDPAGYGDATTVVGLPLTIVLDKTEIKTLTHDYTGQLMVTIPDRQPGEMYTVQVFPLENPSAVVDITPRLSWNEEAPHSFFWDMTYQDVTDSNAYPIMEGSWQLRIIGGKDGVERTGSARFQVSPCRRPIVYLPGFSGSFLWNGLTQAWPLNFEPDRGEFSWLLLDRNGEGVTANLTAGGPILWAGIDIGSGMMAELQASPVSDTCSATAGYREGETLKLMGYDWRQDIRKSAVELKHNVDQITKRSGSKKANLIAHSMGGIVGKYYLVEYAGDHKVESFISFGTPYLGAPVAYEGMALGKKFGAPGLDLEETEAMMDTFPAAYQLLPSRKYFEQAGGYIHDPTIYHPGLNYGLTMGYQPDGSDGMLNRFPYDQSTDTFRDWGMAKIWNEAIHDKIDGVATPGVRRLAFVGTGHPTFAGVGNVQSFLGGRHAVLLTGPGDGTAPLVSAMGAGPGAQICGVPDVDHTHLLSDSTALAHLRTFLTGGTPDCIPPGPDKLDTHLFTLYGDMNVHIYDAANNHTGPNDLGRIEENIPGVSYMKAPAITSWTMPIGKELTVLLVGNFNGLVDLHAHRVTGDQITETAVWNKLTTTPTTQATISRRAGDWMPELVWNTQPVQPTAVTQGAENLQPAPPPTVTAQVAGTTGTNGWYRSNVTVTLSAQDMGHGILSIHYKEQNAPTYGAYSAPVTVSNAGSTTLLAGATDRLGVDQPTPTSVTFKIDKFAPVTTAVASSTRLTLSAVDDASGVARIEYSLNGTTWTVYTSELTFVNGATVYYRSVDVAGNVEATRTKVVPGLSPNPPRRPPIGIEPPPPPPPADM